NQRRRFCPEKRKRSNTTANPTPSAAAARADTAEETSELRVASYTAGSVSSAAKSARDPITMVATIGTTTTPTSPNNTATRRSRSPSVPLIRWRQRGVGVGLTDTGIAGFEVSEATSPGVGLVSIIGN